MSQPVRPHRREIWPSLCTSYDTVSDILWRQAIDAGQPVGTCGRTTDSGMACGRPLRPGEPYTVGQLIWYPASCAGGHETAAHGARPPKKGAA